LRRTATCIDAEPGAPGGGEPGGGLPAADESYGLVALADLLDAAMAPGGVAPPPGSDWAPAGEQRAASACLADAQAALGGDGCTMEDFLSSLHPAAGPWHPLDLATAALCVLCMPDRAAALSTGARQALLRLGWVARYSISLPAENCLLLGEVFADAYAAAGAAQQRAGTAEAQGSAMQAPLALRLEQGSMLWLSRFRVADLETGGAGRLGSAPWVPSQGTDKELLSNAELSMELDVQEGAAPPREPEPKAVQAARYWWARGRIAEAAGRAVDAAQLYGNCSEVLAGSGECPALPSSMWYS
jgi:hypothetical protein